jgi:hypothetical protein
LIPIILGRKTLLIVYLKRLNLLLIPFDAPKAVIN